ncbi:MAG: hypothetical protein PHE58_04320 [Candidatus Omnitrophica bacterium]|nr:hypothetical protein [Candidatus Omnitrophota bacterium]
MKRSMALFFALAFLCAFSGISLAQDSNAATETVKTENTKPGKKSKKHFLKKKTIKKSDDVSKESKK